MDLLHESLAFGVKGFIVFVTVTATFSITAMIIGWVTRRGRGAPSRMSVSPLNERYEDLGDALRAEVLDKEEWKARTKEHEKKKPDTKRPRVYVLDFEGDILASQVAHLREEVTALLAVLRPEDEVVLRLESPGGGVAHYGLAAAQLTRLKDKKAKLTVCVDRVAASGGYMMACVADTIVAAPFAVIGSIGVIAAVPNVHRLLKKHEVDYEELTAGEFKRTVSTFGEITDKGRAKFVEQLEETHALFKDFVKTQRPALDVSAVSTGEYWLGRRAKELGLVDQLGTSDDYLLSRVGQASVYSVRFRPAAQWRQRIGDFVLASLARWQSLTLR